MPANILVTGPVGVFADLGGIQFLGTCERQPRFRIRRAWAPVFNDMGGDIPFDYQYMGSEAFVSLDVNFQDPATLFALQALPQMQLAFFGQEQAVDNGSLMIQEGLAVPLILVWPYSNKAGNEGLGTGIRFLKSWLEGPDDIEQGTRHMQSRLMFHCLRQFDRATRSFQLFDQNIPQLPVPG